MKSDLDRGGVCSLAKAIRLRRAELGLAQADLARLSGVSLHSITDLETGKGNPTVRSLTKLLDCVGLEIVVVPSRAESARFPFGHSPVGRATSA